MSSFSCPHFDPDSGQCWRLHTDCVPGRKGCVLGGKTNFAFSLEERMAERKSDAGDKNKPQPGQDCPLG